jgi:hypothetical protein
VALRGQKLVYSVRELAELAGVSPYRMRNILATNDVPVSNSGQAGKKQVVYASALASALPDLMDSIKMKGE